MSRAIYKDICGGPRQHLKYANLRAPAQNTYFESAFKISFLSRRFQICIFTVLAWSATDVFVYGATHFLPSPTLNMQIKKRLLKQTILKAPFKLGF